MPVLLNLVINIITLPKLIASLSAHDVANIIEVLDSFDSRSPAEKVMNSTRAAIPCIIVVDNDHPIIIGEYEMVPHTLHLLVVRVLNAKLDSKTAGGKERSNIRLYSARSFAQQVVLTLVNSADPQKQHSCFTVS